MVAALAVSLLTAAPASATVAVESITFPNLGSEFYSPFSGPASIKFTFDGTEPDATFGVRIRPAGGTAVHTDSLFVDADDPAGFQTKLFNVAGTVGKQREDVRGRRVQERQLCDE